MQWLLEDADLFHCVCVDGVATPDAFSAGTTAASIFAQAHELKIALVQETIHISKREAEVFVTCVCISVAVKYCMPSSASVRPLLLLEVMMHRDHSFSFGKTFGSFHARLFGLCELRLISSCSIHSASDNARTRMHEILCRFCDCGWITSREVAAVVDAVAVYVLWSALPALVQKGQWVEQGRSWGQGLVVAALQCTRLALPDCDTVPLVFWQAHAASAVRMLDLRVSELTWNDKLNKPHLPGPDLVTVQRARLALSRLVEDAPIA